MDAPEAPATPRAPRWAWWVATGLGSGRLRPAPGTWGSLAALVAWGLFHALAAAPLTAWAQAHPGHPAGPAFRLAMEALLLGATAALTALAVRASDRVVEETGTKDPGYIVADEWAGLWIAAWPLRWFAASHLHRLADQGGWRVALVLALPFLLFRLFDIWKPWPCFQLQELPGGQGIVADDVVAGLYALPLVVLLQEPLIAALHL